METRVNRGRTEDTVTGAIEAQTSRLPSVGFLAAALGCIGASLTLKIMEKDDYALWVGQWVPTILIMGMYNKLVKQLGSDAWSRDRAA